MKKRFLPVLCGIAFLLLAACTKQTFDVSKVACDEIAEARRTVVQQYAEQMEYVSDLFWDRRRALEDTLQQCLRDIWDGGPCDDQWEDLQEAYEDARADISNDDLYEDYKEARDTWNACSGENFDASYERWGEENRAKEVDCQETFQSGVADLVELRREEEEKARQKRDADLAALDELEERCREGGGGGGSSSEGGGDGGGGDGDEDIASDYSEHVDCCQDLTDGSGLPPISRDFSTNPPRPPVDPHSAGGGFYDASNHGITEIFYVLYQFYNGFMGRQNSNANDVVQIGDGVLDTLRDGSEIRQLEQDVQTGIRTRADRLFYELQCNQTANFHYAGSQLITPDLSQTTFNLGFGRFTVYYDAQCTIDPKQCCAQDSTCDSTRCDRIWFRCDISWTMYDFYDFDSWKRILPPGWFGTDFHTFGFWDSVYVNSIRECCEGDPPPPPPPPPPVVCDLPTRELNMCQFVCGSNGNCNKVYTRRDGVDCYECVRNVIECDPPTQELAACRAECKGICVLGYRRMDSVSCYNCVIPPPEEDPPPPPPPPPPPQPPPPEDPPPPPPPPPEDPPPEDPPPEDPPPPPPPPESCEDVCSKAGFAKVGKDWSDYLQSYLDQYTCVSGASFSMKAATIGDCVCSNEPAVTIDQTPPVCKGTPCGDVPCNQSKTCEYGEDMAKVSCNWGGWKKTGVNQFQPKLGK